jgi:hypothetical protein
LTTQLLNFAKTEGLTKTGKSGTLREFLTGSIKAIDQAGEAILSIEFDKFLLRK